jgi:large subunit ribosomal protein L5
MTDVSTMSPQELAVESNSFASANEPRLFARYKAEIVPALIEEFHYRNALQAPKVEKIVLNIGLGESITNAKAIDAAVNDLQIITGQKPVVTRAKKSIATFRLREGMPIGAMVTLRGNRMYEFLDRLVTLTLPRIRDFRGINPNSFDGRGNYTLGLSEQLAFPEIDYDRVDKTRGLELSIVTTARNDEEGRRLLTLIGMPFARNQR